MQNKVTLSVCMITYNHEAFIAQAIEGILRQITDFNIELIIGEDKSTDRTREICQDYADRFPNIITLISTDSNVGLIQNFYRTYKKCQGQFIAFCEGDDFWTDPQKLEKQLRFLQSNPDYSACFHNVNILYQRDGLNNEWPLHKTLAKDSFDTKDILGPWFIPSPSIVFVNYPDFKLPEWFFNCQYGDLPFMLLLSLRGNFKYIPEIMATYRLHDQGMTTKDKNYDKVILMSYIYTSFNIQTHFQFKNEVRQAIIYEIERHVVKKEIPEAGKRKNISLPQRKNRIQQLFKNFWNQINIKKEFDELNSPIPYNENEPDNGYSKFIRKINAYFKEHPKEKIIYKNELAFINQQLNKIPLKEKIFYTIIPYPYLLHYDYHKTQVFRDEPAGMFYVLMGKHKLYYHKGYCKEDDVRKSFTFLQIEQHPDSPHRYLDDHFSINNNDVVVDLGAAEGNFSLMVVDTAREIIIVESDSLWMDALNKTFEPWKHKVRIINKAIGSLNDEHGITLDKIQEESRITAIKMDIEGAETGVLKHAQTFLRENAIKMAITTYHRETDAADIESLLGQNNYNTTFTKGYMLFITDELKPPFFRKAVIKAMPGKKADIN